ncbi:MAG: phosphocholine cytidylyltransferase family protein [Planctomycetota bacterium]|nr:phosphocholine cytidylyltransferase family protein [Planctomycetota bacterium]
MRAIIIGAGRGQRLMPTTQNAPKCYAEIGGRRILDWILEAFTSNGIDDVVFVGGYLIEQIRADYPQFTFRLNEDWPNNNILESLMRAEDLMEEGFVSTYADILYRPDAVAAVLSGGGDICGVVDTLWRERYRERTDHPMSDGEKVLVQDGCITMVHRDIEPDQAHGEFTGVMRCSAEGARSLVEHYHRCRAEFAGKPFREAVTFEKAYLIQLVQEMIERGVPIHHVDVPGEYWEIDTQQDFSMARAAWGENP